MGKLGSEVIQRVEVFTTPFQLNSACEAEKVIYMFQSEVFFLALVCGFYRQAGGKVKEEEMETQVLKQ